MKAFQRRGLLITLAASAAFVPPMAQAQIEDLFRSPGTASSSTQDSTAPEHRSAEPVRQTAPATGKTRQANTPATPSRAAVQQEKLVIYTTPTCPHCIRALKHMQERKIAYIQKDVQHDRANQAELRRIGGRGVPHMLMGSTVVVGFDPADFDRKYAAWRARDAIR